MANDVLRSILANRTVVTAGGIERPLHSAIPEDEGAFLQKLIREHRPRCSLEIGCAYGISSLYICEALREVGATKHIVIDPEQRSPYHQWWGEPGSGWEGIGLENLKRADYASLIEFHAEPSFERLPALLKDGIKVDFAFIDGQHTFDYVMVDFFFVDKLLNVGGIVAFDNSGWPSIRKVCRYVLTNMRYRAIGPSPKGPSLSRRIKQRFAAAFPLSKLAKPESIALDETIGLSRHDYVAMRKEADDLIGVGQGTTRSFDTHNAF